MNRWTCSHAHCQSSCVGIGGAVGLRAIGWYYEVRPSDSLQGPRLYCPAHYPDDAVRACREFDCRICQDVARIQSTLTAPAAAGG